MSTLVAVVPLGDVLLIAFVMAGAYLVITTLDRNRRR